jgi:hypothetical protein
MEGRAGPFRRWWLIGLIAVAWAGWLAWDMFVYRQVERTSGCLRYNHLTVEFTTPNGAQIPVFSMPIETSSGPDRLTVTYTKTTPTRLQFRLDNRFMPLDGCSWAAVDNGLSTLHGNADQPCRRTEYTTEFEPSGDDPAYGAVRIRCSELDASCKINDVLANAWQVDIDIPSDRLDAWRADVDQARRYFDDNLKECWFQD